MVANTFSQHGKPWLTIAVFAPDLSELIPSASLLSDQETSVSTGEKTLLFPDPVGGVNRAYPDYQPIRNRNNTYNLVKPCSPQITPEKVDYVIS